MHEWQAAASVPVLTVSNLLEGVLMVKPNSSLRDLPQQRYLKDTSSSV
jgi:hypothetical protein